MSTVGVGIPPRHRSSQPWPPQAEQQPQHCRRKPCKPSQPPLQQQQQQWQQEQREQRPQRWQRRRQQQQQAPLAARPDSPTFPLADLPAELLLAVAVRLPTPADAQHLLCQTSREVRQRAAGHLGAFPVAWLLHNRPTTALIRAARRGDAPLLSALLAARGERPDKKKALAVAAAGPGRLAALEVLLAAGAAPQAGLCAAARAGVREAVRALMAAGAEPFADGGMAVGAALTGGKQDIGVLQDILGAHWRWFEVSGSNEMFLCIRTLCHPFVAAARFGDWAAVDDSLRRGYVDGGDWGGYSSRDVGRDELIAWAAEAAGDAGRGDMAMRLVAAAWSEDWQEEAHQRALTAAAYRGRLVAMHRLMERRPKDLGGVMMVACQAGSVEAVRVLRAAGAEVDLRVVSAAAHPYEDGEAAAVLRVLLEGGDTDPTAWSRALCSARRYKPVLALLAACRGRGILDLEAALRAALPHNRADIVRALLQEGARVGGLGPAGLGRYAGQPDNATRQALQAAGVDFGAVDAAAAAAAAAAEGPDGMGRGAV